MADVFSYFFSPPLWLGVVAPSPSVVPPDSLAPTMSSVAALPLTPSGLQQISASSSQNQSISSGEIRFIVDGCFAGIRSDGRSTRNYRPYIVTPSGARAAAISNPSAVSSHVPLVLSNGSSRVSLPGSDTDVICSVRADLVRPAPERPAEGTVELKVDLLPSGASASGGGGRRKRTEEMEITAILTSLQLPHAVDRSALCVVPGKYVWRLAVDVLVLTCDGNVIDVCAMAIRAAIRGTVLPMVTPVVKAGDDNRAVTSAGGRSNLSDDFIVDGDIAKAAVLPGSDQCPVVVTAFVLEREKITSSGGGGSSSRRVGGSVLIVDPVSDEEMCSTTRISVGVDPEGNICGVHKHGSAPVLGDEGNYAGCLQLGSLLEVTDLAISSSKKLLEVMTGGHAESISEMTIEGGDPMSDDLLGGHFVLR